MDTQHPTPASQQQEPETNGTSPTVASGNKSSRSCIIIAAVTLLALIVLSVSLFLFVGKALTRVTVSQDSDIYMTPSQIESIRDIGQWEFLTINAEELIDTTRQGVISDDHLARIYYGTLRLGIDLSQTDTTCIRVKGDTILFNIPDIQLLDENFIDEARTRSFHETGSWTAADRNAFYDRARHKMKARTLTPENIEHARQIAETQVRQLLNSMGFKKVEVSITPK